MCTKLLEVSLLVYSSFAPLVSAIMYIFYNIVLEVLTSENDTFKVFYTNIFTYLQILILILDIFWKYATVRFVPDHFITLIFSSVFLMNSEQICMAIYSSPPCEHLITY